MNKNVKLENELYEPMRVWLQEYLEDRYPSCKVVTQVTSEINLDDALQQHDLLTDFPKIVGLPIQIDVLGIMIDNKKKTKLAFIEAKKSQLNLHNLGQLLIYCRLANPSEAFLMSSLGMGSLNKLLRNLNRLDILTFGNKSEKMIHVSTWNILEDHPDMKTMIPSI
ncbi:hypothetical protein [Limosilactobacillus mucosae]|uniref:hypothetical protein n=1 Tax=Limosilactobacillus mucosae TaxID=97478 RepID=UPI0022E1359D|nr:hypothetical protein [Limosilactobacillus mucosae]